MLNLFKCDVTEGVITSAYEIRHTTPGRDGTTLALDVVVQQDTRFGVTKVRALLDPRIEALDTEAALDKLADWAERLAVAVRHRGVVSARVPSYENPIRPPVLPDRSLSEAFLAENDDD